ncbi:MAG: hypothetical protein Q8J76_03740, partial [Desulfobulbaceae bacterium]|nr:hypothetical protein [Desulfobulbaceae bacterium]
MIPFRRYFIIASCLVLLLPTFGCEQQRQSPTSGARTRQDGSIYAGSFNKSGKAEGEGTITYPDGRKYTGQFVNGIKQGNGTMTFANGSKYTGSFINDLMEGQGTLSYPDGQFYTGQFKNGKFHGAGTFRYLHATFT